MTAPRPALQLEAVKFLAGAALRIETILVGGVTPDGMTHVVLEVQQLVADAAQALRDDTRSRRTLGDVRGPLRRPEERS